MRARHATMFASLGVLRLSTGCSCRHDLGTHSPMGGCCGLDSYGVPCTCPSFELSQEEAEALERGESL